MYYCKYLKIDNEDKLYCPYERDFDKRNKEAEALGLRQEITMICPSGAKKDEYEQNICWSTEMQEE